MRMRAFTDPTLNQDECGGNADCAQTPYLPTAPPNSPRGLMLTKPSFGGVHSSASGSGASICSLKNILIASITASVLMVAVFMVLLHGSSVEAPQKSVNVQVISAAPIVAGSPTANLILQQGKQVVPRLVEASKTLGVEMEKLRIYVYEMPSRFTDDILKQSPWCRSGTFSSEVHMHQSFLADAHRTLDPSEAHFFYVPVYAACLIVRNFDRFDEYRRLIGSALEHIRTQHPFFNASHGADHVFLFAHDFGACLGWTSETSAVHFPAMRHAIFLTHNGDLNLGCFSPQKDVVIPPYYSDTAIAAIAQRDDVDRAELDGVPAAKNKTIFAYFRGTLHWRHASDLPKLGIRKGVSLTYSQGVRQSLARLYGRDPLFLILEGADGDYVDEVQSALFCLCPRGFASWSRRLFDAIAVGCIPVIISDDAEHPFERIVDYRTFSIRIAESDLPQLKSVLLAVPPAAVQSKLDALARVAPLFAYREAKHDTLAVPTQVGVMYGVLMQLAVKSRTTHSSAEEPWM